MSEIKLRIEYDGIVHEDGDQCVRTEYYKESEIEQIKDKLDSALKLQELVKDKMNMEQPHENDEAYWTDPYQLLHSLVEESEK